MNAARHLTRLAVVCFLAGVVILNYYHGLAQQLGGEKKIQASLVLRTLHRFLAPRSDQDSYSPPASDNDSPLVQSLMDEAMAGVPASVAVKGTLWSMRLGPVMISDPLAVVESLARTKRLHWAFLCSVCIPAIMGLLLGRVFCSWACPMGLLSEVVAALRRVAGRWGIDFPALSMPNSAKHVVLVAGIAVALFTGAQVFYFVYPPRLVSAEVYHALRVGKLGYASVFIAALLMAELVLVKRLWCRCLCPGGAIYSLLGATRLLRIRRDAERCIACRDCDRACPHNLEPSHLPLTGECDNCGLCRAACPTHALAYRLGAPGRNGNREPSEPTPAPQPVHEPVSEGSESHV